MDIITILQIVISIALVALILLQRRDSDLSGFLGGGAGGGGFYQQRRGMERMFFILTIILVVIFAGLALFKALYTPTVSAPTDSATSTTPAATSTSLFGATSTNQ